MGEVYLLKKLVDKSLLNDGMTIPSDYKEAFYKAVGFRLEHGESADIMLSVDGIDYKVKLTNVNFSEAFQPHIDVVQIRYSKSSAIAVYFRNVFRHSADAIEKFYAGKTDTKHYKPEKDGSEYIEFYPSAKRNTLVVRCLPIEKDVADNGYSVREDANYDKKEGQFNMDNKPSVIIKFDMLAEQTVGNNMKIIGLIKAKCMVSIIDGMGLEANPRSSATGAVTKAIQESIAEEPELFPFKTKGILLASSVYDKDKKNRVTITISDPQIEGILDGGHNTLAIGMYILRKAMEFKGIKFPKGSKTWDEFKQLWNANHDAVLEYIDTTGGDNGNTDLDFLVPVELLVPANPNDKACVDAFKNDLLEICAARNNNVQLQVSDKDNQRGYYDSLKAMMEKYDPALCKRIEWKSNDGGEIDINSIIALAWIPLSLITPVSDADGKKVEPVTPSKLYSGKGACLKQYERLMSSPDVTMTTTADYKVELKNSEVISALQITVELPALFDYIFEHFPDAYNAAGGSYGSIKAVKSMNKGEAETPYKQKAINTASPEGFIMPVVYGLQALMEKKTVNGTTEIVWKCDPYKILAEYFNKIVSKYCGIIAICDYDSQKVGKAAQSYINALDIFKMAVAGIL